MKKTKLNPRYLAYCRAHGRTPAEQRAHDEAAWPGGRTCGFMLWISAQARAFRESRGFPHDWHQTVAYPEEWDAWLERAAKAGELKSVNI